jgi:Family of unknown function (DUF6519)
MKGDFTRVTFDPINHFTRVLTQQGRVQLDADANEQTAILLHYLQTLAADLIGPHGGPATSVHGFQILFDIKNRHNNTLSDLTIGSGRYYVDGILCENDAFDEKGAPLDALSYYAQGDYPFGKQLDPLPDFPFLLYLDVWEHHITALDAPSIREVALGMSGPDTTTRAKLVWQVKALPLTKAATNMSENDLSKARDCKNINDIWDRLKQLWQPKNRGHLLAGVRQDPKKPTDACTIPPDSRYRGAENQLYRVEIHKGGTVKDGATFKWSRDNGAVVAALMETTGGDLMVSGIHDGARGFAGGQWVELTGDALELRGESGTLVRLVKVEDELLTIDPLTASGALNPNARFPDATTIVRRWDQREVGDITLQGGAVPINEGVWIDLEDGIRVQFQQSAAGDQAIYRTGDYWLIPARRVTGDVEWPRDDKQNPKPLPPHGVEHHYAPLATITDADTPIDLRHQFPPLAECEP